MAVPFLTQALGPDARLVVQIAWGADLAADASTWAWTDITTDVRMDPGISWSYGRADEASTTQPATCTMTLDNTGADYSLGPDSPNYPHVRRNTPVRVLINPDGSGTRTGFFGYATGFTPAWNVAGTVQDVRVEAAGILRRLIQGNTPVLSPIRRAMAAQESTVGYWPLEDGSGATVLAAGIPAAQPATFTGTPKLADNSDWICSSPLPTLADGVITAQVPTYAAPAPAPTTPGSTGAQQVRALFVFPDSEQTDQAVIMRILTNGTVARWDLRYNVGGAMDFKGYDQNNVLLVNQGAVSFNVLGTARRISVEMYESGGLVYSGVNTLNQGSDTYYSMPGVPTIAGSVGTITAVVVNPDRGIPDVAIGHITVQNEINDIRDVTDEMRAYTGEYITSVAGRLARLCEENGVPYSASGAGETLSPATDRMGPQPLGPLVELLREAELADQGTLYDGVSNGLTYTTRRLRENRAADLTISAATAKLASPFGPVDDDQRNRNRVEVKRSGGSSAVLEDRDGPTGIDAIGLYDTSVTVNTYLDGAAQLFAGWLLAQGTVEGYRYPTLTVDLRATPELAADWLDLRPGNRIDVTGVDDVLPGHPGGTLSLLVEGKADSLSAAGWIGTARCSPYAVWRIGTAAANTGSTGEYVARGDTDGSELAADAAQGATSISVATTSGPVWTTTADDFPLELEVGGRRVTVTACLDATSPQTMTVEPLAAALSAGAPVALWNPTRTGL